jgi:hypothetical protein
MVEQTTALPSPPKTHDDHDVVERASDADRGHRIRELIAASLRRRARAEAKQ